MGGNIPWGKAVILLLIGSSLFGVPTKSRNNYKKVKIHSFYLENTTEIDKIYNSATKEGWEKYLNTTYRRLEPYRDYIAQVAYELGVPYEVLYLPIIESGALPFAISRTGAVGLWQFMPSSAREQGLKTTTWVDERRDFVKATYGALEKLKFNYEKTGDWLLALAAYNCGINRVLSTMNRTGIRDYWELSEKQLLPRETLNYVPKLILVSKLLQNKKEYKIDHKWENKSWDVIPLKSAVDLSLLAREAGVPLGELKTGNTDLNYQVTPPASYNYSLKVPLKYSYVIREVLDNSQKQLLEFYRYEIKSGDTLSHISLHYGVSTREILSYNPGVTPKNLRIGKVLIIPGLKKVEPYSPKRAMEKFNNEYIVKNGDTLWGISVNYNTTIEDIAYNSGIDANGYLKEGMKLRVP
jgi:membrane-bound lytic murein transglycosylase D